MDFQQKLTTDKVTDAYPAELLYVEPDVSVAEVLGLLKQNRRGCMLICRDGRLVGIFTERDAIKMMAGGDNFGQPISAVMRPAPKTMTADDTVSNAIKAMHFGGYRRLPIVDDAGRPLGHISLRRLVRYLAANFPTLVYTLPPTPHHTPQDREGA